MRVAFIVALLLQASVAGAETRITIIRAHIYVPQGAVSEAPGMRDLPKLALAIDTLSGAVMLRTVFGDRYLYAGVGTTVRIP